MHLLTTLKMDEQGIVEDWKGGVGGRGRALSRALWKDTMLCRKSPRSLLHGKTILSGDLSAIGVCWVNEYCAFSLCHLEITQQHAAR